METDGRHDYLICKELLVGFVVTGLDCLEARGWVVYFCGCVYVSSEGGALMCPGVGGCCLCAWMPVCMCECVCPSVRMFECITRASLCVCVLLR